VGVYHSVAMNDYFFTRRLSERDGRFILTFLIDEKLPSGIRRRKSSFEVEYDTADERNAAAEAWMDDRLKALSAFF
jgi:hypothetical protein